MARGFFSDFLGGLAQGTQGLPQAIQTRERMGLQREQNALQAEHYKAQIERLNKQEDSKNWQWRMKDATERGDTDTLAGLWPEGIELGIVTPLEGDPYVPPPALPSLPPGIIEDPEGAMAGFKEMEAYQFPEVKDPRLRDRLLFVVDQQEKEAREEEDKAALLALQLEQAEKALEPEWKNKGNGFYRVVDGSIETHGDWNPKGWSFDFENGVMWEEGTNDLLSIPEGVVKATKGKYPKLASTEWGSGQWIDEYGGTHQMDDKARGLITQAFEDEHLKRMELIETRGAVQTGLVELRGRIRASAAQLSSEKKAYNDVASDITNGKLSLNGAIEAYYGKLKAAHISDARHTAQSMTDHFAFLTLDRTPFQMSGKQKNDLAESGYIWGQAEEIKELLGKPTVRAHMGVIQGRLQDMKRRWTGDANADPDVARFRFLLADMSDRIQRIRTGAVINESERPFYNDLLGTTLQKHDAVYKRMLALQETMQGRRNTLWQVNLQDSFAQDARKYYDKIPRYQPIYDYTGKADPKSRTEMSLTDEDME